jgi:hypothetical protein
MSPRINFVNPFAKTRKRKLLEQQYSVNRNVFSWSMEKRKCEPLEVQLSDYRLSVMFRDPVEHTARDLTEGGGRVVL